MSNKIRFGLENVHVAFKGVAQVETIEILTGCTTDGEVTVTVTSVAVTDSPVSVTIPLSTESHATAAKVASQIAYALNDNTAISTAFKATTSGAIISLAAKVVAANDGTLEMAVTGGTTGVTAGASTAFSAGTTGYGAPIPIPGAVSFTRSPEGEENTFYADNSPYYSGTSNNGYTGDLEMALVPDAVLAQMLGWEIDSRGGIVEIANGTQAEFALLCQIEGDQRNRRTVFYSCKTARPEGEDKTKEESIEPTTEKLSITMLPMTINGKPVVKYTLELSDTNESAYNSFFSAVMEPAA